jgi:hypothetical protein
MVAYTLKKISYDLMVIDLKSLIDTIGEVTGEVTMDDIRYNFSEFYTVKKIYDILETYLTSNMLYVRLCYTSTC